MARSVSPAAVRSYARREDGREQTMTVRLDWDGKPERVERVPLPFQTVETINESRATRDRDRDALFRGAGPRANDARNLLIWGDNQLVLSSLLAEFAGQVDLIYIDPPFATGADFSHHVSVGDVGWVKAPSILEEHAYRDTWGAGYESYLTMLYDRLALLRDLLSSTGSIYLHLDWRAAHYGELILDELLGPANFQNEIVWRRANTHNDPDGYGRPSQDRPGARQRHDRRFEERCAAVQEIPRRSRGCASSVDLGRPEDVGST